MNKSEQLIACLEGEIAKRDARIVELQRYEHAFNEWHDKTEWVQAESATLSAKYLGCHRADVMRSLIDDLRAELAACRVAVDNCEVFRTRIAELESQYQRDVYGLNNEGDPIGGDPAGGYANDNARLRAELAALKAQGVVMPAELDRAFITGESCDGVYRVVIQSETLKEMHAVHRWLARLNAAPAQHPKCKTCDDNGMIGGPSFYAPDDGGEPCPDCCSPVQQVSVPASAFASRAITHYEAALLAAFPSGSSGEVFNQWNEARRVLAAAPAAPAADAGIVDALDYQALFDAIAAATSVYANGAINISVQAFRGALAAHRAKGVV